VDGRPMLQRVRLCQIQRRWWAFPAR
jgi:hypothetical protein